MGVKCVINAVVKLRRGGKVAMATGKVKWFNNAKGYGFVIAEAGGEDLFVPIVIQWTVQAVKAGRDVGRRAGPRSARREHPLIRV